MLNSVPSKHQRPYAVLGIFVGGLVAALLPKDLPGEYDSLVRAAIVGVSAGSAAALILWFQARNSTTTSK
ncbi:MAG: hypothetical protein JSS49_12895 [Planctomycetes bacterium]|nr:hypothetical protein [Planctomycetota bacterium]